MSTHQDKRWHALFDERVRFEAFMSAPPFEREIARWPDDPVRYAWPGQYRDLAVQLAWEAWLEARGMGPA